MKLTNKFSNKCWTKGSINTLLKRFGDTRAVNELTDSAKPRSTRTKENVDLVNEWKRYTADSQNGP